jgi:regulator of protease activity HflC (stomatin/prohibitin superfamily)
LLKGNIMETDAKPSTDSTVPPRKPVTKNYGLGVFVNITLAVIAYFIGEALATYYLKFDIAGIAIGILSSGLSLVYFGMGGLREIPIAHRAVPLAFGTRQEDYELNEGWVWNWPAPIRDVEIVDVREQTRDVSMTEVLTDDNVPVIVNLSVQYRVINLFTYLSAHDVPNALEEAIDNHTRILVQEIESDKIAQEKKDMSKKIMEGFSITDKEADKKTEVEGIAGYAAKQWGIEVIKIRITQIRLPEEMEAANTAIKVQEADTKREIAQKETEMVEAKHVAEMIAIYQKAGTGGLSAEFAANMAQTERKKATRIIIDGSGSPLEKVGVAAAILNNMPSSPSTTEPSGDNPGFKGSRKRKEGK